MYRICKNPALDYLLSLGCIVILFLLPGSQTQTISNCYVFGTEHVVTFDGERIDVISSAACQFDLVYTCPTGAVVDAVLDISIINVVHREVSRVDCVQIEYSSFNVKLCSDQKATVNGKLVQSLLSPNGDLMVYTGTSGIELSIQTSVAAEPVIVTMTSNSMVRVSLPSSFSNKLCGLCGNYDADGMNDLVLSNGTDVSSDDLYQRSAAIAGSHLREDPFVMGCDRASSIEPFIPSGCEASDLEQPEYCGVYQSAVFESCSNSNPDLGSMFESLCEDDFCENYLDSVTGSNDDELSSGCELAGDCVYNPTMAKQAVIAVAEVFVDECRNRGVDMGEWRGDYSAEVTCPGNTAYSFSGDTCPLVCGGREADRCQETNRDGCACADGLYRDGSSDCVAAEDCGCKDPTDGSYHMIGDTWLDSTCSTNFTCPAGDLQQSQVVCSEFAFCENADGVYQCTCNTDYAGDGYTCLRQCEQGQQPTDDQEMCRDCPVGTYQPLANQQACLLCPEGEVTPGQGTIDESECSTLTLAPDTMLNPDACINDVLGESFETIIPSNVLPDGLPYGEEYYTELYTSTNGIISFGTSVIGWYPSDIANLDYPMAAPFWFLQDLRGGYEGTSLCLSSYNLIDTDPNKADESRTVLSTISLMLSDSELLESLDFKPVYALVATWHRSVAFPHFWYAPTGPSPEFATYQAVVATDGLFTFLMHVYPAGEEYTQLRSDNIVREIRMGYNNLDTEFSVYLSGTSEIARLSSEPSNTDVTGRWVFEVAKPRSVNPFAVACLDWYSSTTSQPLPFLPSFFFFIPWQPCPCNLIFAIIDRRYFFTSTLGCASTLVRRFGFYQMCCYDLNTWQLITHPALAGYPTQHLKDLQPMEFMANDQVHFENCCHESELCDLYRERRPVPTCVDYIPPWIAMGFGDPHIFTLDGFDYTYNPVGEFWLINSTEFKLQARMMQTLGDSGELIQATQFQAVAMQSETTELLSDRIHIELNNNRTDFVVYQNDISLTPVLDETVFDAFIEFAGGIIRKANESISVVFDTGFAFTFSISLRTLNIESLAPDSANGTTRGLLGTFDGDQSNDLTNSTGDIVCVPDQCTAEIIHEQFGESWRITQEESIFWYRGRGWDTETYTDRSFQPIFLNQDEVDADVKAACNDDVLCIFDSVATNSTDLGVSTKEVFETVVANVMELNNLPPILEGPTTINASINNTVTVMYTFGNRVGQNGSVILNVTSMPEGADVVLEEDSWTMTWSPTDFTPVTLSMFAVKTDSVDNRQTTSSELNVDFRISPDCVHGSPQNFSQLAPGGTITVLFHIVQCICEPGWEGETCGNDTDGCADRPCNNATCTDVAAEDELLTGESFQCENITCPEGYEKLYNSDCFDIDECAGNHSCFSRDLCINTRGSYFCNCPPGYAKSNDTCNDIDECSINMDMCSDICHNTNGSFECSCFAGASLREDNVTCDVIVASGTLCAGQYNCSYTCSNDTDGNEVCVCPRNRMVDPADNQTCIEFNECLSPDDNACDASTEAQCEDLLNGYKCNCPIGYIISASGLTCEKCSGGTYGEYCLLPCHCADRAGRCDHIIGCTDCRPGWTGDQCVDNLNECLDNSACPESFNCFDTPGSFRCECPSGYYRVSVNQTETCEDVNECTTTQPCHQYATCENTRGSFTCVCIEGYTGNGFECSNINECALGEHDCDTPIATCQDKLPGYGCFCQVGYYGDGKKNGTGCTDDNECLEVANACPVEHALCQNTIGSYICVCEPFYFGDGNVECYDIDECANTTTNNCTTLDNGNEVCVNEDPLYRCERSCNTGYKLIEEDGIYSCIDVNECLEVANACPVEHALCENTIGSYICDCEPFYFGDGNVECFDIDECANTTTNNCTTLINGNEVCVNEDPLYRCERSCDTGYKLIEEDGIYSCIDDNECDLSSSCPGDHESCNNTEGSFDCYCDEYYESEGDNCVDINECLISGLCDGDNKECVNEEPNFRCACYTGYLDPNCEEDPDSSIVDVEQTLDIPYNSEWNDFHSAASIDFRTKFEETVSQLFNLTGFEGVNIRGVKQSPDDPTLTTVDYEVVYSDKPQDLEQQIYYRLVANNNSLEFDGQMVQDLNLLKFENIKWKCEDGIKCENNFECQLTTDDGYAYCLCSELFSGYNCSIYAEPQPTQPSNLLVLWISVGIAGGLLIVGLAVCTTYLVFARRKKFVDRPSVHRFRRGPALFNPSSRLPAEAFNYQFPTASVRDTDSSSGSTVSRSTDLTGRVGALAGFAPRWPKAYYSQLDDADSH